MARRRSYQASPYVITDNSENLANIAALEDPVADKLLFKNTSTDEIEYLGIGSNLVIAGGELDAASGGGGGTPDLFMLMGA
jgi:hypothetical protein